jgi:hypothetical protein
MKSRGGGNSIDQFYRQGHRRVDVPSIVGRIGRYVYEQGCVLDKTVFFNECSVHLVASEEPVEPSSKGFVSEAPTRLVAPGERNTDVLPIPACKRLRMLDAELRVHEEMRSLSVST